MGRRSGDLFAKDQWSRLTRMRIKSSGKRVGGNLEAGSGSEKGEKGGNL